MSEREISNLLSLSIHLILKLLIDLIFRPEIIISDQSEEVMLMDFNPETESRRQRDQREAYDDDDHPHGPRGVQCATQ